MRLKTKANAVMIPPLFVITTEWAQPNGTTSRRKSRPMQTESQIRTMLQLLISTRTAGWIAFVSRKPQGLGHRRKPWSRCGCSKN